MPSRTRLISKTEDDGGKFVTKEVRLVKQRSEFGFRIVGGAEVDVKVIIVQYKRDSYLIHELKFYLFGHLARITKSVTTYYSYLVTV